MTHSPGASRGINSLALAWSAFWFKPAPAESFAILRMAFGALGLLNLAGMTPVSMFWALDGIAPLPGSGIGVRGWLQDLGLGGVAGWTFFAALGVAFSCMTLGLFSSLAVRLSFLGTLLQTFWNHLPLSSANQVLAVVLFCLMWADCGLCWSLDSWRRGRSIPDSNVSTSDTQSIWPLRLIQIQVCLIYLNSGLWKFSFPVWRDGSAIYYAGGQNIFHRFPWMPPPELDWVITAAAYLTVFWEIGFVVMVLRPWSRRLALATGVAIHLGVWLTMEVGLFSWVMMATYFAFLDPEAVARRFRVPRKPVRTEAADHATAHEMR